MSFEVAERTLSPEVSKLLEGFLGCKIASEGILPERKQFDFFLILDHQRIVVELKIGFPKLNAALVQAEEYKEQLKADGIIAIAYPDEARQTVSKPQDVTEIALQLSPTVTVLTPFLKNHYPKISLAELASNLKESLAKPTIAPSINLVVQVLRQSVQGISLEIRHTAGVDSPIIRQTVGSLALFEILSEEESDKDKEETAKGVVADLAAYILVNQLLLYHILNKVLDLKRRIETIVSPLQLRTYFKKIVDDIDYKAVYCIDIVSNIPSSASSEINTAILAIRALQPENLRHDLLGRIFHEFLPHETRKRLGTFYTRPQAADILAGLAIEKANEKIVDPACGSGTLLVSAYRRKMSIGKGRPHKNLVEEEITGVDIMPFAAHLAALNLTMQSPLERTDKTRIGSGNSLNLTVGDEIGSVANWFRTFGGDVVEVDVDEPLSKGEIFKLLPADTVIMNPPFTRKERLTPVMKGVRWSFLGDQNYWAYFIPLADSILKNNGKIAAVLPRDFFRGEYSRTVREYLFKTGLFNLRYVVKTTKDTAFSENARFRDFLIVLEKGNDINQCAFIYLKKKLTELTTTEASRIPLTVRQLNEGEKHEDDSIFVTWKEQSEISKNWRDLGQLVTFNTKAGELLLGFHKEILKKAGDTVIKLSESKPAISVIRGLEPSTENLLNLIFVVRPIHKRRAGHSEILLSSVGKNIDVMIKGSSSHYRIPHKSLQKGLKTAAYVPQIDVSNISDYAILKFFEGFDDIQTRLGFSIGQVNLKDIARKADGRMTHLLVARRFNFAAPGTKALAFFCSDKALVGKAFWALSTDVDNSKVLCLWWNSTFAFIESLLLQSETEGSFIELTKGEIFKFHIPNLARFNIQPLLDIFEDVKDVEFPALIEQFDNPPEARKTIDRAMLKAVGYSKGEIERLLTEIYQAMAIELKSWRELMHQSVTKSKEASSQLHLFVGD